MVNYCLSIVEIAKTKDKFPRVNIHNKPLKQAIKCNYKLLIFFFFWGGEGCLNYNIGVFKPS